MHFALIAFFIGVVERIKATSFLAMT